MSLPLVQMQITGTVIWYKQYEVPCHPIPHHLHYHIPLILLVFLNSLIYKLLTFFQHYIHGTYKF